MCVAKCVLVVSSKFSRSWSLVSHCSWFLSFQNLVIISEKYTKITQLASNNILKKEKKSEPSKTERCQLGYMNTNTAIIWFISYIVTNINHKLIEKGQVFICITNNKLLERNRKTRLCSKSYLTNPVNNKDRCKAVRRNTLDDSYILHTWQKKR
jgi:hypothetical protein